jgi:NTP pyrophosphatase (non-canonical NTP hydrolase)
MSAPYNLGSRVWPGLSKLTEEAGEVIQVAGKIMGTGGEHEHWDGSNLLRRAGEEVADLSAACRVFFQLNGLDGAPWVLEREQHKYRLFLKWHFDNLEDKPDQTGAPKVGWAKWQRLAGAGSDLHYQIYWAWRIYRRAVVTTMVVGGMVGFALSTILQFVAVLPLPHR